ncbi:MAG TPA: WD40 repeat domain-containing protein [Ktedonobacteraceae bacterium]|nr:WD40 repeat domain-containing protein [Ktedonobacteraceae bacterium]
MPHQEKRFTARRVDAQFEQFARVAPQLPDTPNNHVVESLQTIYGAHIHQEQQSIDRMRQCLSLAVAAAQKEQQNVRDESRVALPETTNAPEKRTPSRLVQPRHRQLRIFEQAVAVFLVLAIVAGWFAVSHLSRSSNAAFSDADARPLGEPISTSRGNFSSVEEWSPDGRAFVFLQVDSQKHILEMHIVDIASRRSTVYPVLDSSWIPALNLYDPFGILMGRYLLAERAQGQNQATMVIWDITGRRAITTQTVPAQIGAGGQVLAPWIVSSDNEQKLAVFAPDGTVSIWDVASGRKLVTCEGKASYSIRPVPPTFRWYNHDRSLLFLNRQNGVIEAWDVNTGVRLFNLHDASKKYIAPVVSPDNKYLALTTGHQQTVGNVTSFIADALEILDAHSGQVLHSYPLHMPTSTAATFAWLSDSQRLVMTYTSGGNSNTSSSYPQAQIYVWNVFTGQKTFVTSYSQAEFTWTTPDGRYLILGGPDGLSMQIWQTSNGRLVATIATPGIYARTDSFSALDNQYIVIGQKGDFDIWDIATGKLLYKYHGTTPFSITGVDGSNVFWSPDGKYLTMLAGKSPAIGDGVLSIWRML